MPSLFYYQAQSRREFEGSIAIAQCPRIELPRHNRLKIIITSSAAQARTAIGSTTDNERIRRT